MGKLEILVGIPGSGKSTYCKHVKNNNSIVNPDSIRKILTGDISNQSKNREVWEITYFLLENLLPPLLSRVILDATNVNLSNVKKLITLYGARHQLSFLIFNITVEEAYKRIQDDITNGVDRSNVPLEVIEKMHFQFKETVFYLNTIYPNLINIME